MEGTGRPSHSSSSPASATAVMEARPKAAKAKRKPLMCRTPGCQNKYFPASGKKYLCYPHFIEAGGKHPSLGKKRK